jgi:hypothetical protein
LAPWASDMRLSKDETGMDTGFVTLKKLETSIEFD